jgi:hypothetical protein
MNKQKGYFNFDLNCWLLSAAIAGGLVGIAIWEVLQWLWPYLKAALHAATG